MLSRTRTMIKFFTSTIYDSDFILIFDKFISTENLILLKGNYFENYLCRKGDCLGYSKIKSVTEKTLSRLTVEKRSVDSNCTSLSSPLEK